MLLVFLRRALVLGVLQVIEHLQTNKQFFVDYAKVFEKSVPEIDTWRNVPTVKKLLEV